MLADLRSFKEHRGKMGMTEDALLYRTNSSEINEMFPLPESVLASVRTVVRKHDEKCHKLFRVFETNLVTLTATYSVQNRVCFKRLSLKKAHFYNTGYTVVLQAGE